MLLEVELDVSCVRCKRRPATYYGPTGCAGIDPGHFAPLFYRREQRDWAAVYLRGLLTADVPRKNVEAMALRLLGVGPHAERQVRALQQFIGEGRWDDEAILAEHQRLVNETLGEEDGVLNTLGSDFPKHGDHSAGVAPQWCGNTGKKDNCQAGVFLGYASRKGATLTSPASLSARVLV